MGTGYNQAMGSLCHTACGFFARKNKCTDEFFFSLTKTKAVEKQKREDDTSFILRVAVSGDDSLERGEKNEQRR